jgi:hypothetical protein
VPSTPAPPQVGQGGATACAGSAPAKDFAGTTAGEASLDPAGPMAAFPELADAAAAAADLGSTDSTAAFSAPLVVGNCDQTKAIAPVTKGAAALVPPNVSGSPSLPRLLICSPGALRLFLIPL